MDWQRRIAHHAPKNTDRLSLCATIEARSWPVATSFLTELWQVVFETFSAPDMRPRLVQSGRIVLLTDLANNGKLMAGLQLPNTAVVDDRVTVTAYMPFVLVRQEQLAAAPDSWAAAEEELRSALTVALQSEPARTTLERLRRNSPLELSVQAWHEDAPHPLPA